MRGVYEEAERKKRLALSTQKSTQIVYPAREAVLFFASFQKLAILQNYRKFRIDCLPKDLFKVFGLLALREHLQTFLLTTHLVYPRQHCLEDLPWSLLSAALGGRGNGLNIDTTMRVSI
jgi:hypothetical protein